MLAKINIIKKIPLSLIEQLTYSAQSFILLLIASSLFGKDDFGLFNLAIFSSLLFSTVVIAATFLPMVSIRSRLLKKELPIYDATVGAGVIFLCTLSVFIITLIFVYVGVNISFSFLLSLSVSLKTSYEYIRRYYIVVDKNKESLLFSIILIGVLLVTSAYSRFSNEKINLEVFLIMFAILYLIPNIRFSLSIYPWFISLRTSPPIRIIKLHLKESKWLIMTSLTQIFSGNYFLISLTSHLGPFYLGVFRTIQSITNIFNPAIAFLDNSIYVKVGRIKREGGDYKRFILRYYFIFIVILLPPIFVLGVFSDNVVLFLYGKDIAKFSYILPIFLMSILVVVTTTFFRLFLRIESINSSSFWVNLVVSISAFVLSPWLISDFGILGAAVGLLFTQVSFLLGVFLHYCLSNRLVDVK